jgi:hypothetical protein
MKIWTLRHKATGKFMPSRMFKQAGKGWTYWNPYEERPGYTPHDTNPRVFFTLQSARNAKVAWCAGEWNKNVQTEGDWETGYFDYLAAPVVNTPSVPRSRDDLEIVEGELVLP